MTDQPVEDTPVEEEPFDDQADYDSKQAELQEERDEHNRRTAGGDPK